MNATKFFSSTLLATMILFLASCSSSSMSPSNNSSSPFNGKWVFSLVNGPQSSGVGQEIDVNFSQSGNAISSTAANTVDGFGCTNFDFPPSDITTGTVSGTDFNLLFTLHSGQPNAQNLTLTGTLSSNGPQVNGTYIWSAGDCNSLQTGTFTAAFVQSLTGQYSGVLINDDSTTNIQITGMITEDPDFQTSASINVMNNSCLSSITPSANQLGVSIGRLTAFFGNDGSDNAAFIGTTISTGSEITGQWTLAPGCANVPGGTFDFDNVAKSGAPAPMSQNATAKFTAPTAALLKNFQAVAAARHTTQ